MDASLWTLLLLGIIFGVVFGKRGNLPLNVFCLLIVTVGLLGLTIF